MRNKNFFRKIWLGPKLSIYKCHHYKHFSAEIKHYYQRRMPQINIPRTATFFSRLEKNDIFLSRALKFLNTIVLWCSLKPLNTIVLWWYEGFQEVSSLGHTWLIRDASLSDSCRFFSLDGIYYTYDLYIKSCLN